MKERYLEVTYRKGKAFAAYLYLPRNTGAKSARTEKVGGGMLVDYAAGGEAIGIEVTDPESVTPEDINRILDRLGQPRLRTEELGPLAAA
jgi:uncharacterized protein YuzE